MKKGPRDTREAHRKLQIIFIVPVRIFKSVTQVALMISHYEFGVKQTPKHQHLMPNCRQVTASRPMVVQRAGPLQLTNELPVNPYWVVYDFKVHSPIISNAIMLL